MMSRGFRMKFMTILMKFKSLYSLNLLSKKINRQGRPKRPVSDRASASCGWLEALNQKGS